MSFISRVKKFFGGKPENTPPPPSPPPPPPPPTPPPPPGGRNRDYWVDRVVDRKEEIWGDTGRYNPQRAARYVDNGVDNNPPPTDLLRWAATAPEGELQVAIHSKNRTYSFLYYH